MYVRGDILSTSENSSPFIDESRVGPGRSAARHGPGAEERIGAVRVGRCPDSESDRFELAPIGRRPDVQIPKVGGLAYRFR